MRKNSMQFTYIRAFVIFIAIPILVINLLLNNAYKSVVIQNYSDKVAQSLEQIKIGLEDEIKRTKLALSVVANDRDLIDLFARWKIEKDLVKRFNLSMIIDKQLNYLFSYSSDVHSIIIFFKEKDYYFYRSNLMGSEQVTREKEWYKETISMKGITKNLGFMKTISDIDSVSNVLATAIKPKTLTLKSDLELIYVEIISTMLKTIQIEQSDGSKRFIIDSNGNILADSTNSLMGTHISEVNELKLLKLDDLEVINEKFGTGYYISKIYSKKLDWYIVDVIPKENITKSIRSVIFIFYSIYFILLILFFLYALVFFKGSIIPIKNLVNKMKSVNEGNLDVLTEVAGPLEIRELNTTFNHMMARINLLIDQRDEKEKLRSEEEIKALQSQINPHFIYNTLNTIKIMAMMTKANNIKNMLEAFMKVIELTFKKQQALLRVDEEVKYLKAYIVIMKARFGDFFDVRFRINDGTCACRMMKMLVQPFVENAIIHGLHEKQNGLITVTFTKQNNHLLLIVEDNGTGMTKEEIFMFMNQHLDNSKGLNHIGVCNVKRRIELTYGKPYTVKIESEVSKYTRVLITLPVIDDKGGDKNE